ncbi:MAG: hypothetical protein IJU33_10895, partial [Bacteroidales bacterium]|nr:hypothetical protein [Bacteroidales bacterium]
MKRLLTLLLLVLLAQAVWAQNSTKLSYQAVVRNANNELVANVPVTVEVSILDATSGTTWYTETHSVTTNANGLITLMIGEGTPVSGNLKDVAWDNASIKTSIGAGGENIDNTTAVNAVPYALHADSAKTVNREVLNEQIHEITDQAIANLNQRINTTNSNVDALGQKLTDTLGYYATQQALVDTAAAIRAGMNNIVTDETDPTVPDWAKAAEKPAYDYSEIQNTPNLDGYLTSETDPTVPDWAKASTKPAYDYSEIVNTPSLDGYLTSETDPNVPDWAKAAEKPSYSYDEITGTPDLSGYLTAETDPTVNNSTITVKQGETTLGTFTTNAGEDVTIAIPEAPAQVQADWNATEGAAVILNKPINVSAFTNDAGYLTTATVQEAANIPTNVSAFNNDANYITAADIPAETDPTVKNTTITFTQGETTLGSFTTNTATETTINIPAVTIPAETDPTVPEWAKAETKPAYSYDEISGTPDLSGYLTEHQDLSGYAKLTDIPTVPTKVSELTNDVPFLTEHQDLSEYAQKSEIPDVSGFLTTETDPTVNNSTITVKQGETTLGTFTTNAGEDVTIAIPEAPAQVQADWNATEGAAVILNKPTDLGDFTNTPGYVTAVDVAEAAGVPTKVSQLENDANYITAADIPAETDPTVKNTTITFTQGETTLGSFTTNTATETT